MRNMAMWILNLVVAFALVFSLIGNTLPARAEGGIYYVSPAGNDSNTCSDPALPCATIQAAVNKSTDGDTINVAIGTYTGTNTYIVEITKPLTLIGGWDSAFTVRSGFSTIDGQNARYEINVPVNITASIEHFSLTNGKGGIYNFGDLSVSHLSVTNHIGDNGCWGGGISNLGKLLVHSSEISGNTCGSGGGYGGGIYNWQYGISLTVINSSIHDNNLSVGGGIYSNSKPVTIINSTISNNNGKGIVNESGAFVIKNSTIAYNDGGVSGGGIYFSDRFGGSVTLENSILNNNVANSSSDCYGPITSLGYNIISDSAGCSFTATTGDQVDVDALLGPLQDNGGYSFTHWLYQGSLAIDGGNPAGCTDHLGNTLATDQRGFSRPLDGNNDGFIVCDIGAYEADPANLPPVPPTNNWYVKPGGNNANSCLSPQNACATINGAINKSSSGDTIFVATGNYTAASGTEVVLLNKNLTLSGGWNLTFLIQSGLSTVDGQVLRRGITVEDEVKTRIEQFKIQNGYVMDEDFDGDKDGGGIFIGWRGNVTLVDSIVYSNQAGRYLPSYVQGHGGGVAMSTVGYLKAYNSTFSDNTANGFGGGIYNDRSTVILNNCTVSGNSAEKGGGLAGGDQGTIIINNGTISNNYTTLLTDGDGGGIYSFLNTLSVNGSTITGNTSSGRGGGISGSSLDIENSVISNNQADVGGGLNHMDPSTILNSSILNNTALYQGGGINSIDYLYLINTTIAYNSVWNPYNNPASGGGIYNEYSYPLYASNVTITRNYADDFGGGVWAGPYGGLVAKNTIIADNTSITGPDCRGNLNSNGYNLIGNTQGCTLTLAEGDLVNISPGFAFLLGWPSTMALRPDSLAIDAGNHEGCKDHNNQPIITDQLGTLRPMDGNNDELTICDIGAFEFDPSHPIQLLNFPLILN